MHSACSKDLRHDNIVTTHLAALHVEVRRMRRSGRQLVHRPAWRCLACGLRAAILGSHEA